MQYLPTLIGLLGASLALLAYFLISTGKLRSDQMAFPLLNMIGSMGILVSLYWQFNLPSAMINAIWVVISIVGIWRILSRHS